MKIGFNLLAATGHVTDEHLPHVELIKKIGYDGVELPVFEGDEKHYAGLGRHLKNLGLASTIVTVMGEDANPASPDKANRGKALDRLRWALDNGAALGATVLCGPLHSPLGVFSGTNPSETELSHCADTLREASAHGQKVGVHVSIEALNRFECYMLNTMAQASDLRRRVAHPNFSYMYDTFHANIEERDPVAAYKAFANEITHIHISENDRGIPGRGHTPLRATIAAAREAGYQGWMTVEAFGRALPALAAATRVWRDLFPDFETLYRESHEVIRRHWDNAA